MIETVEDAMHEVQAMIDDAVADSGCSPDDIAHDMVVNVAWNLSDELALELCRRELGFVPYELRSRLGDIDFLED